MVDVPQSSLAETLILGAFGSVIGTFLFLIINSYWLSYFLPKIKNLVYRGVRVEGEWKYVDKINDKEHQTYILNLKQSADVLTGTYSLVSDILEGKSITTNILTGYIADGFVIATARPSTNNSIYHSTFMLKVVEDLDGVILKGMTCAINLENNEINNWLLTFKN